MTAFSCTTILHMGGYAQYVWPAYGVVALVLVGQIWQGYRAFFKIKNSSAKKL